MAHDHQDLHSFPTRRSSDLEIAEVHRIDEGSKYEHRDHTRYRDDSPRARQETQPKSRRWLERGAERDRKSTRLNSSHSQISYAVFCLKKKNRKNRAGSEYRR